MLFAEVSGRTDDANIDLSANRPPRRWIGRHSPTRTSQSPSGGRTHNPNYGRNPTPPPPPPPPKPRAASPFGPPVSGWSNFGGGRTPDGRTLDQVFEERNREIAEFRVAEAAKAAAEAAAPAPAKAGPATAGVRVVVDYLQRRIISDQLHWDRETQRAQRVGYRDHQHGIEVKTNSGPVGVREDRRRQLANRKYPDAMRLMPKEFGGTPETWDDTAEERFPDLTIEELRSVESAEFSYGTPSTPFNPDKDRRSARVQMLRRGRY
jgi:hypothetical protein